MEPIRKAYTLCWDCEKATGGCSWSNELIPVKGWSAKNTTKKGGYDSFYVYNCPLFERDAYKGGTFRLEKRK